MPTETLYRFRCDAPHCQTTVLADTVTATPKSGHVPVGLAVADAEADDPTCWCGWEKEPGQDHSMCYPGME